MVRRIVRTRAARIALCAAFATGFMGLAQAKDDKPVAELSATVTSQVEQDQVQVVLAAQAQGKDPQEVNASLTETIREARARLGDVKGVRISTGSVQTYPQYDRDGKITGWQGRSELVLRSLDIPATAQVADKVLDLLAISNVSFSLSDSVRQAEQSRLMDAVAQAFRDKATTTARVFGFRDFEIQKLVVSDDGPMYAPRMMSAVVADSEQGAAPLSLEPGTQRVSVTVSGQVELR